jgi:hypothetical protein
MNYARLALAAIAAFVAYFVIGGLTFTSSVMREEFLRYSSVYRSQESMKSVFPIGMAAMLVAMFALVVIYSLAYRGGSGLTEGARFGALVGAFAVCAFVIHNYVNLNIGGRLTLAQAIAYFFQWLVVGIVIGLIYKPTR